MASMTPEQKQPIPGARVIRFVTYDGRDGFSDRRLYHGVIIIGASIDAQVVHHRLSHGAMTAHSSFHMLGKKREVGKKTTTLIMLRARWPNLINFLLYVPLSIFPLTAPIYRFVSVRQIASLGLGALLRYLRI